MLLAVDIGNSSTKLGVFEREKLVSKFSIPTSRNADASFILDEINGRLTQTVDSVIIASVVPEMDRPIREYLRVEQDIDPVFVDHFFDFGLKINYEPITSLGIDRLVNASAAALLYGTPCIVCSFGTATTIDVVSSYGEYLGGVIAPGMQTMSKALHIAASKLPEVEIEKPDNLLGGSTIESIRSGIFYGYIGLVEGLIERIVQSSRFSVPNPTQAEACTLNIVAAGGFAEMVAAEVPRIDVVNTNLTLEGLRLLFEKMA